jgi:DNA-binding transcriptional MerR regulator
MYRSREVAARLGVSATTIRRHSVELAAYLGPSASAAYAETGGPTQRRYSDEDLALLAATIAATHHGLTFEEIRNRLDRGELGSNDVVVRDAGPPGVPLASGSASESAARIAALEALLAERERTVDALSRALAYQDGLLAAARASPPPPALAAGGAARDETGWRAVWRRFTRRG